MACVHNASWVYQRRQNVRTAKIDPDGQDLRVRRRRHVADFSITERSVLRAARARAHAAGNRETPNMLPVLSYIGYRCTPPQREAKCIVT